MIAKKITSNHKRTVESIEICEEYNIIRFKLLNLGYFSSMIHSENALFSRKNNYTFTFNKDHVRAYNKLALDMFYLPSGNEDKTNVLTFIADDLKTVNDLVVDLNCNEFEQYNNYLKEMEKNNKEAGEHAERIINLSKLLKEAIEQKQLGEKEAQ